tara:strand:- start:1189 stop:1392 length:204 start_codon:yes stop_codon:yes gene_type:complete
MEKNDNLDNMMLNHIVDLFEKKNFKNKFIKKLNDSVDIPLINEKTEKKVLNKIYELLVKTVKDLDLD